MIAPAPLRAIFFDLDDTLCDTEGLTPLRLQKVREAMRGEVPEDLLESVTSQAVAWDSLGQPNSRLERMGDALGLTDEQRQRMREVYNRTLIEHLRLYPDVREMLVWLRQRVAIGLITNGPSALQRAKLGALGIGPYFHSILISEEAGFHKPDPKIYLLALASQSVEPYEALYIGDRPDVDIAGARASGIPAIQIKKSYPFPLPEGPEPDYMMEGIGDLRAFLETHDWVREVRKSGRRVAEARAKKLPESLLTRTKE